MQPLRISSCVAVALCVAAATAHGQTARGTVVDASQRAASGVVVQLIDSASGPVARTLSDLRGSFSVAAARAGTYRLRVLRIGYRPTVSAPFQLSAGGESVQRLVLEDTRLQLDTVKVVDRNSCHVTSEPAAAATFAILEQVRTALTAAQLTLAGRTIRATTLAYERELDPDGRRVLQQSANLRTDYVAQPWRAAGPDSLHRAGFVVEERDRSMIYHAPSIEVLLSNQFLDDHCFRLAGDRRQPGLIGIAFDPSPERRKIAEVRGTLWVDRKSSELQRLEYRYVNITDAQQDAGAGGDVSFSRLANGGWAITRWNIRMPVLAQTFAPTSLGGNQVHLSGIQVAGGELTLASLSQRGGVDTLWVRPPLAVRGTIVDSSSGRAIANARVVLQGTSLEARSDDRGRFSIVGAVPGDYVAETASPEMENVGFVAQSPIHFVDSTATFDLRVPGVEQLASSLCGANRLTPSTGIVVGSVHRRGASEPPVGATITAEWVDGGGKRLAARSDARGIFRMCGVPIDAPVRVRASTDSIMSDSSEVRIEGRRFARVDLVLDRRVSNGARFTGTVRADSTRAPIVGAEVALVDLGITAIADGAGSFGIEDIPAGPHHVVIRRIGFGALDTTLTFSAKQTVDHNIVLSRTTVLDAVRVNENAVARQLLDFEDNRRLGLGSFMTRADLDRLGDVGLAGAIANMRGMGMTHGAGGRAWIYGSRSLRCPPGPIPVPGCDEAHGVYFPERSEINLGMNPQCYALVYVDGQLVTQGSPTRPFDVSSIPLDVVEAVEFYRGPSETPTRYANRNTVCGVLVIHTKASS